MHIIELREISLANRPLPSSELTIHVCFMKHHEAYRTLHPRRQRRNPHSRCVTCSRNNLPHRTIKPLCAFATDFYFPASPVRRDHSCDLCKSVLATAFVALPIEPTGNELTAVLRAVCAGFVLGQQPECNAFVQDYAPDLLLATENERDESLVCTSLGVC